MTATGLSVLVPPSTPSHHYHLVDQANAKGTIGTYKPQIHVHSTAQLSLSYSHHTDVLNHSFELLSADYTKSLHLQTDRTLEFYTPSGRHYATRIPRYGRDLKYDRRSAEALIPAVGVNADGNGEVFRLNLELGRFMRSYALDVGGDEIDTTGAGSLQGSVATGAVTCATTAHESHSLLAFGTSKGTVEFFDPRARTRVAVLQPPIDPLTSIANPSAPTRTETTALQFHPSGLSLATGASTGLVHLYDLRSNRPLLEKDHGYGYPVKTLKFLTSTSARTSHLSSDPKILSADKRIIKIWDARTGAPWTSVEPTVDLNCVEWIHDTGMLLTANEGRAQHSFFIPSLGPAPRWCSFLDNMVEEMAEDLSDPSAYQSTSSHNVGEVYDNYKFLTQPQMAALGLEHLVGTTGMVRPYMHGFFVQQGLYEEARVVTAPEVWAEEREKKIRERIEKERESRIRGSKKVDVRVNRALAERVLERQRKHKQMKARRAMRKAQETTDAEVVAGSVAGEAVNGDAKPSDAVADNDAHDTVDQPTILTDPRFSALFNDPSYAIDESSREYATQATATKIQQQNERYQRGLAKGAGLTAVEQEALDERRGSSSDDDSGEDGQEDEEPRDRVREAYEDSSRKKKGKGKKSGLGKDGMRGERKGEGRKVQMHVSSSNARPATLHKSEDFGARLASDRANGNERRMSKRGNVVGEKEMTFTVDSRSKGKGNAEKDKQRDDGGGDGGRERRAQGKERRSASGNVFRRM